MPAPTGKTDAATAAAAPEARADGKLRYVNPGKRQVHLELSRPERISMVLWPAGLPLTPKDADTEIFLTPKQAAPFLKMRLLAQRNVGTVVKAAAPKPGTVGGPAAPKSLDGLPPETDAP